MSPATTVLTAIDATIAWQEELYRHLHQNPELSMQEAETAAEVTRRLESFGYAVQQIGGGVVGVLDNGPGATVLFRADMDALPVEETTGLPYASTRTSVDAEGVTVPVMHACGHDLHITAGLGAAEILSRNRDAWSGTYIALFQPGEETAHLVTLFLTIPNLSLSAAYLVIATVDLALLAFCVVLYRRLWRQPEYTLFWRRAVAW